MVGSMVDSVSAAASGKKGRPKEDKETKKRVSLSVFPSLYEDIQRIAYVRRRSLSDLIGEQLEQYRKEHENELKEYEKIKIYKKITQATRSCLDVNRKRFTLYSF